MITVNITDSEPIIVNGLTQWDYGQKLQITGLNLPEMVEIHFSLSESDGNRVPQIGHTVDNVTEVEIPDFILQNEGEDVCHSSGNYYAYAFVYVVDGESGQTERKITLDIERSPKPTADIPDDEQDKFLKEVRQVMAETKEIAQSVRDDADSGKFDGKDGKDGTSGIDEETFLKLAIKPTTDKATFHHITDSAEYRVLEFGMEGKTEQETTSGKNKLDVNTTTQTVNGLTFTVNADKSVSVSGTATADTIFWLLSKDNALTIPSGEYAVSGCPSGGGGSTYLLKVLCSTATLCSDSGNGASFSISEDTEIYWNFTVVSGITINATLYPMVRLATETDTSYEPYTNGPSPNPEYQQEITNAGVLNEESGRYEHKCCVGNKNLFDVKSFAEATGQTINDDGSIALRSNAKRYYFDLPDIPVSFTWDFISTDSTGVAILKFVMKDGSVQYIADSNSTIKIKKQLDYVTVLAWQPVTVKNLRMMYDSSTTDYTPHASQPFTLTSPVPLTKWDYKAKRDGIHGWSINSINPVLNGTEHWVYFEAYNAFYIRLGTNIKDTVDAKCSHYLRYGTIVDDKNNIFKVLGGAFDDMVWIRDTRFNNVEDFKAWLSENNVMLSIPTVEEQAFIPLPDDEQILLNNLETYYEVTNIYNDQGCPMWIKYVADSKLYIDNQILEIKQSIV